MSNDRYERIRAALAKGPTPGPWLLYKKLAKPLPKGKTRKKFAVTTSALSLITFGSYCNASPT